jgi:hypothetical protein
MNNFNQWAKQLNVGTRYQRPIPPPNCHYFDVNVFKQSIRNKPKTGLLKYIKRLLGIAVIIGLTTSCSTYTGIKGSNGCGVWFKKKYNGKAPHMRSNTHMISF